MENEFEVKKTEVELEELGMLDLDNENDLNTIEEELGSGNMFFNPDSNKTYKINLTDSKTQFITKIFKDEEIKKVSLQIKAIDRDKNEFVGVWECGFGTFRKIVKILKSSDKKSTETAFKMTKTGSGLETRYDIVADDF